MNNPNHTSGPWRIGNNYGSVVCDTPIPEISGSEHTEHYGGHLVAESIAPKNRAIIAAAPEIFKSLNSIVEYCNNPQKGSLNDHVAHSLQLAELALNKATNG